MSELQEKIREYLDSLSFQLRHDEFLKNIKSILESLTEAGTLALGEDKDLGNSSLEIRARLLLKKLGFNVEKGRPGMEDFVVIALKENKFNEPLVVEVKSSRKPNIGREDLRQLDDWVFDLSGEEKARKEGLGGDIDPVALVTGGLTSSKRGHPTPHKGILIFNGPVGINFNSREECCFNENDREFIEKRNLCIAPIETLVQYESQYEIDQSVSAVLWERLHTTIGILSKWHS
ncbi:MAG: hypothetical protein HY282_01805 [Nitrospirae bacterium]|nr:hypothetical protein [Candidatus Manganitrophaceae bacterium]